MKFYATGRDIYFPCFVNQDEGMLSMKWADLANNFSYYFFFAH